MQDPWHLVRDWGRWPGCPERGVAAGIVLWRGAAGAAGSSCCVLDCQHINEGGVKSGTGSFGWFFFFISHHIIFFFFTSDGRCLSLMHQRKKTTWKNHKSYTWEISILFQLLVWCHLVLFTKLVNIVDFYILSINAPNKPASVSEHWSPLQTLHRHHRPGSGISEPSPCSSFSWELRRLSMSRLLHLSALAALGLTPGVRGHRITGSTMPEIVDCWC